MKRLRRDEKYNIFSLENFALQPGEVVDAHSVLLPTDRHKDVLPFQHLQDTISDYDRDIGSAPTVQIATKNNN